MLNLLSELNKVIFLQNSLIMVGLYFGDEDMQRLEIRICREWRFGYAKQLGETPQRGVSTMVILFDTHYKRG